MYICLRLNYLQFDHRVDTRLVRQEIAWSVTVIKKSMLSAVKLSFVFAKQNIKGLVQATANIMAKPLSTTTRLNSLI